MPRFFIELSYKGTAYHGFQIQENAPTVQLALEKALLTLFKEPFALTGSSRTDAGVHALQNYFHFDTNLPITEKHVYNLNAILPEDIAVRSIRLVSDTSHCRFDALGREYHYYIYQQKDPFMKDRGWYYPFELDFDLLQAAAANTTVTNPSVTIFVERIAICLCCNDFFFFKCFFCFVVTT